MSNTSKMIMWLVVLVVVIGGIWYFTLPSGSVSTANNPYMPQTNQSGTTHSSVTTVTTVTNTSPTSANDTSDAAINQDVANIDGQMTALNADNATAASSMNSPSQ